MEDSRMAALLGHGEAQDRQMIKNDKKIMRNKERESERDKER